MSRLPPKTRRSGGDGDRKRRRTKKVSSGIPTWLVVTIPVGAVALVVVVLLATSWPDGDEANGPAITDEADLPQWAPDEALLSELTVDVSHAGYELRIPPGGEGPTHIETLIGWKWKEDAEHPHRNASFKFDPVTPNPGFSSFEPLEVLRTMIESSEERLRADGASIGRTEMGRLGPLYAARIEYSSSRKGLTYREVMYGILDRDANRLMIAEGTVRTHNRDLLDRFDAAIRTIKRSE